MTQELARPYLQGDGLRRFLPEHLGPVDAASPQNRILVGEVVSCVETSGVWLLTFSVARPPNDRRQAMFELLSEVGWPYLYADATGGTEAISIKREQVSLVPGSNTDLAANAVGRAAEGSTQRTLQAGDRLYLLPRGEGLNSRMVRALEVGMGRLRDQANLLVGMMDPRTTDERFLLPLFRTLVSSNAFLFIVLLLVPPHRLRLLLEAVVPFIKGKWTTDGIQEVFLFFTGMRTAFVNYWRYNLRLKQEWEDPTGSDPHTLGRRSMLAYDRFMSMQSAFDTRYNSTFKGNGTNSLEGSGFLPNWFSTDPDFEIAVIAGVEKELLTPWSVRCYLPIHPVEGLVGYMAFILFRIPFACNFVIEPVYLYDDFVVDLREALSGYYFDSALVSTEIVSISENNLRLEVTGGVFTTDSGPVGRRLRLSMPGGALTSDEWTIVERISDTEVRVDRPLGTEWIAGGIIEYVSPIALGSDDKGSYLAIGTADEPVALRLMSGWSMSPRMVGLVEITGAGFGFVFQAIGSNDIFIFGFCPRSQATVSDAVVYGLQRGDTYYPIGGVDLTSLGILLRQGKERLLSIRLGKLAADDFCQGYWQLLPYSISPAQQDFLPSGVIYPGATLDWNGDYWSLALESAPSPGALVWVSALGEVPSRSEDNFLDREWQDFILATPLEDGTVFGWRYFLEQGGPDRPGSCIEVRIDWDANLVQVVRYNAPAAPVVYEANLSAFSIRLARGIMRNINVHVECYHVGAENGPGEWTTRVVVAIDHDIVLAVTDVEDTSSAFARGMAYALFLESGSLAIAAYCTAAPIPDHAERLIVPYWNKGWVLGETPLGSVVLRDRQPGAEFGISIDHDRVATGRIPGWPIGRAGIAALRFDPSVGTMAKVREWRVHADLRVTDFRAQTN